MIHLAFPLVTVYPINQINSLDKSYEMVEKPSTIDELFAAAYLSDPLKTYRESVDTIENLVELGRRAIIRRTEGILEYTKELERMQKTNVEKIAEETASIEKLQRELEEPLMWISAPQREEIDERTRVLIQQTRQLISDRTEHIASIDLARESQQERLNSSLESSKIELPALLQMAFIYLVTVWDAFVLDTARAILRIHPELISKSENKTDLAKSDLWFLGSTEELREALIELEIRRLDGDRKKLAETFNSYWGIDWGDSGIQTDTIVEIRARRDLWVHNRGRVNNQYIQMVRGQTPLGLGQIAEIDREYFTASLFALTQLAVGIHRIADEKHYSKST